MKSLHLKVPYLGNVLYKSMLCSNNELKDIKLSGPREVQRATKRFCFLPHQMECGIESDTLFSIMLQYPIFPLLFHVKEQYLLFHQVVITHGNLHISVVVRQAGQRDTFDEGLN